MHSLGKSPSRAVTEQPAHSHIYDRKGSLGLRLRQFWLRKSIFMPSSALPEAYAARRHIPGVNVPKV